jgi:hypothetical protein
MLCVPRHTQLLSALAPIDVLVVSSCRRCRQACVIQSHLFQQQQQQQWLRACEWWRWWTLCIPSVVHASAANLLTFLY